MNQLIKEIRHNPLLWLLVFVPLVFVCQQFKPEAPGATSLKEPFASRGGSQFFRS